ncbi:PilZ domain-containing protein [Thermodesulfobacteriota bacterium]
MDNNLILNSISIGGAIFVGLILFWFVSMYLKKRLTPDQSAQGYTPSPKISWEEKRRHPRIAISWQASIETSDQTDNAQIKDISLGGAFVVCSEPLALNAMFKISIRIPNQAPLRLKAEVVWSNRNMSAERVVNRGMGIRFIDNTEKDRRRLNEVLAATLEESQSPRS